MQLQSEGTVEPETNPNVLQQEEQAGATDGKKKGQTWIMSQMLQKKRKTLTQIM